MKKFAIHLLCRRDEGGRLKNLSTIDAPNNLYRSGYWKMSQKTAESLVGGWIYLHPGKALVSEFGGVISGYREVQYTGASRVEFDFVARREGRGQSWRGRRHAMAWGGEAVAADLEHEIDS